MPEDLPPFAMGEVLSDTGIADIIDLAHSIVLQARVVWPKMERLIPWNWQPYDTEPSDEVRIRLLGIGDSLRRLSEDIRHLFGLLTDDVLRERSSDNLRLHLDLLSRSLRRITRNFLPTADSGLERFGLGLFFPSKATCEISQDPTASKLSEGMMKLLRSWLDTAEKRSILDTAPENRVRLEIVGGSIVISRKEEWTDLERAADNLREAVMEEGMEPPDTSNTHSERPATKDRERSFDRQRDFEVFVESGAARRVLRALRSGRETSASRLPSSLPMSSARPHWEKN